MSFSAEGVGIEAKHEQVGKHKIITEQEKNFKTKNEMFSVSLSLL